MNFYTLILNKYQQKWLCNILDFCKLICPKGIFSSGLGSLLIVEKVEHEEIFSIVKVKIEKLVLLQIWPGS